MITVKKLLFSSALFISQTSLFAAATDQTDIELSVTHVPYVKFIGTAPGSSRFYDNDDIANWIFPSVVNLGTLGLESNITGSCDINFSTLNNFQLIHTTSGNRLTKYKVVYQSQDFSETTNPTLTIPCNTLPTTIEFTPTQLVFGNFFGDALIESGIYQDIVHVTVTTQ